jgi:hypothetical protein
VESGAEVEAGIVAASAGASGGRVGIAVEREVVGHRIHALGRGTVLGYVGGSVPDLDSDRWRYPYPYS